MTNFYKKVSVATFLMSFAYANATINPITAMEEEQQYSAQQSISMGLPVAQQSISEEQLGRILNTVNQMSSQINQIAGQVNQIATSIANENAQKEAIKAAIKQGKNPMEVLGMAPAGK